MPLNPLDLYDLASALTEEERMVRDSVARLVDEKVLPVIQKCFEDHRFPRELIPELAALGLLGSSLEGCLQDAKLCDLGGHGSCRTTD